MTTLASNAALASQAVFRAVMEAFARPGEIKTITGASGPAPLAPASAALAQSLADYETPIWLDRTFAGVPDIAQWIRFYTGAPIIDDKRQAAFAFIADAQSMPDVTQFALGSEEYPDRSTTLIVQVARFCGRPLGISGPGIKGARDLAAADLPEDFAERFAANRELFPRGVDLVLVAGNQIAALPRSIRISRGPDDDVCSR